MSKDEALYQSLAACGAMLIAFIGVCHEVIGGLVFPWAPVMLGPIGWHALGLSAIVLGSLTLAGTLKLIRFPVVPFALLAVTLGVAIGVLTAILHREFHMFAFAGAAAGAVTAVFHGKADVRVEPASVR